MKKSYTSFVSFEITVSLFTSIKNAGNDIKKVVDIKRNSVGGKKHRL
jgi:hypothetical protein